ncbi:MAG: ROK family protein [Salinivirgaceae bacterium]|nr:ROK family protein [Salinivirgaceae bacterium]
MHTYKNDKRTVLTLDAGGTNFVYSAIQAGEEIVESITKPSYGDDLDKCLQNIILGFELVISQLKVKPVAISFAFPGPADYPNGIIGDLGNLPAFKGGVALGPMLEEYFHLPVFINNDGNLFAYGEAIAGILPEINEELTRVGSKKQYKNLIGLTLGTGFGAGLVFNNLLLVGDNSLGGEIWLTSNRVNSKVNSEEIVSTRSILATYAAHSNELTNDLMPVDIYKIAKGEKHGNREAAKIAFEHFGRGLGDAVANLITLFDGIVVIGGGITGAQEFYMPALFAELQNKFENTNRLVQQVFNYSDVDSKIEFLKSDAKTISIPYSKKTAEYDSKPRIALAHSKLGASRAIQLGAYVFALNNLEK